MRPNLLISNVLLTLSLVLIGCGKDKNIAPNYGGGNQASSEANPATPVNTPQDSLPPLVFQINVTSNQLTPELQALISETQNGHHPERELLKNAFLQMAVNTSLQGRSRSIRNRRAALANEVSGFLTQISGSDPHSFKLALETATESRGRSTVRLRYNYNRSDALDPYIYRQLQCYSGTMYFELARIFGTMTGIGSDHPLVIYTKGHVLPGYAVLDYQNRWHLYGIETTASGRGQIYYGPMNELNSAIRVVRANDFILSEIFKPYLTDLEGVKQQALNITSQLYGIPLSQTETAVSELQAQRTVRVTTRRRRRRGQRNGQVRLNVNSPFSFGIAQVERGIVSRTRISQRSNYAGGFVSPQTLSINPNTVNNQAGNAFIPSLNTSVRTIIVSRGEVVSFNTPQQMRNFIERKCQLTGASGILDFTRSQFNTLGYIDLEPEIQNHNLPVAYLWRNPQSSYGYTQNDPNILVETLNSDNIYNRRIYNFYWYMTLESADHDRLPNNVLVLCQ